jgi:biotin operon repressor
MTGIGGIISGLITSALGVAGLMAMYGAVVLPIPMAPLVAVFGFTLTFLLFAAIVVIGVVVVVQGAIGEPRPVVIAGSPVMSSGWILSELDVSILRKLSEKKPEGKIADELGISTKALRQKIAMLQARGYIVSERHLTEKGYGKVEERKRIEEEDWLHF